MRQPRISGPIGRGRASYLALTSTMAAMSVLSAFAWWSISEAGRSGDQLHVQTAEMARYQEAATALAQVQAAEAGYTLRPSTDTAVDLTNSQRGLDIAILHVETARTGGADRAIIAPLGRMDGILDAGIDSLQQAVSSRDAANVVTIDATQVRAPIAQMRSLISRATGLAAQRSQASLADSRAAGFRLSVVAVITAGLGVAVTLAVLLLLLMRGRLAEAHEREVALLRTALVHDNLTGLRNHRGFLDDLRDAVAETRACSLLLVDLDDLRAVNDAHGHRAGDDQLVKLADALRGAAPEGAIAYRTGGDEFAVLTTAPLDPEMIAQRMSKACAVARAPRPSATVGYSLWHPGMSAEELTGRADLALVSAKRDGIAVRPYTRDLDDSGVREASDLHALRAMIERPQAITPVFQPIFDLGSLDVVGFEALARFPAESGRTTQEWFDLAHRHGMATELEGAAAKAALAIPGRPAGASLSLNVSPEVLLHGREHLGLPRDLSNITIEVTEDALVTEGVELEQALLDLRARGARIAVDDAGAGYAGFAQLVRVRPDVIKLDRSLIENVNTDSTKAAVVKAFVGYAGDTGALICAEGIETQGELRCVKRLGVATAQGYLLGRPLAGWVTAAAEAPHAVAAGRVVELRRASGE
jgi:diguanylate cyclase (GGDEF)-like protein